MKTFNKSLIAASIVIASTAFAEGNHITQVDAQGHVKKDFALTKEAGQVLSSNPAKTTQIPTLVHQSYTGQAAIDFLGDNLANVASELNFTVDNLKEQLLSDPTIHVDKDGKIFVADEYPASYSQKTPVTVPFTGDVSKLHSKPGAKKTLLLDFDGFDPTGTAWASSQYLNAWNGTPANLYQIWSQVAEDYAAFDVDVTTEDVTDYNILLRTSADDDVYGFRVVITSTASTGICSNCGGIAYLSSVNRIISNGTINPYQPALVFGGQLANQAVYIAKAASHEGGHALGLTHDGYNDGVTKKEYYAGDTEWGPIMGAAFSSSVTQWSKGEYYGANNKQDDLLIISQNFPYRTDGITDDFSMAPALELDKYHQTSIDIKSVNTIITNSTDKDVYSFTTSGGSFQFTATPQSAESYNYSIYHINGNLRPKITVLDEAYNPVTITSVYYNPLDWRLQYTNTVSGTVPAGKYYVVVEGTGYADVMGNVKFSNYGSIGQYTLTGNYIPVEIAQPPVAVANADITSGTGPLSVNFNSDGSQVGYGTTLTYQWDYSDGAPSDTGPTATHTFKTSGLNTVTLTVMNEAEYVRKATVIVDVKAPLINIAKIKKMAIKLTYNKKTNMTFATATATVVNEKNKGVIAIIHGYFDGSFDYYGQSLKNIETSIGTSKSGTISVKSPSVIGKSGTMSFTITNIEYQLNPNLVFDKGSSVKTTISITK